MKNKISSLYLISIFKNVLKNAVVASFVDFLSSLNKDTSFDDLLKKYSDFIYVLYNSEFNQDFYSCLKHLIYTDENILSKGCTDCIRDNESILNTARYELSLFDELLKIDYEKIKSSLLEKYEDKSEIINHLPVFYSCSKCSFDLDEILKSYLEKGFGEFSCYSAFKFTEDKKIIPIKNFNSLTFNDLKNYEYQQNIIKQNTKAFLEGKEANNILLYGDRGCGKSSSVKALIDEFADYNLKIIQVYKESFIYLSELYEKLSVLPLKFIIFADDISFDEDDKNFSSIKAILEGSLSDKPSNTLIYATTNRMHLVKESFSSRAGNEVHCNDTIDEIVSLSDRFGIMLTFSFLTKSEYLDIVKQIANDCGIEVNDKLYFDAEKFAALKAIRTPRVARQFITDYIAGIEL